MKITKRQLRRIIRESIDQAGSTREQIQSAFNSGADDAREEYDPKSYHDWIEGNPELMDAYDAGYEEGLATKPGPERRRWSRDTHKDMDIGIRGLPGVHGVN